MVISLVEVTAASVGMVAGSVAEAALEGPAVAVMVAGFQGEVGWVVATAVEVLAASVEVAKLAGPWAED